MTLQKRSKLSLLSPAKVNLFFLILSKRSDHYHEIASLYQAIDLFDNLTFEISATDQFTCNNKSLISNDNHVLKALRLFRNKFNIQTKLKIHLEKNIPVQAGLGGGSSNAATALFAYNLIFNVNCDLKDLIQIAEKIGADVPFFFSTGSAICTGKGEIINNISIKPIKGWILKPSFGVSTPKVYAAIDQLPIKFNYHVLLKKFQKGNFIFINELQPFARKIEPKIAEIEKYYPKATMTGSGSCFFTLEKPYKSNLIEMITPFKSIKRSNLSWYSINQ